MFICNRYLSAIHNVFYSMVYITDQSIFTQRFHYTLYNPEEEGGETVSNRKKQECKYPLPHQQTQHSSQIQHGGLCNKRQEEQQKRGDKRINDTRCHSFINQKYVGRGTPIHKSGLSIYVANMLDGKCQEVH
jgi:hypothetical protein